MRVFAWFVVALWAGATAAWANPLVSEALDRGDPHAIEALLKTPGRFRPAEAAVLEGVLAAMRFDDRGAAAALTRALKAGPMAPAMRRRVSAILGGVQLRAHDYRAALAALDEALAVDDPSQTDDQRLSLKQTRDVAFALRAEAAQTHDPIRPGAVAIARDMANLARSVGRVNGIEQELVLDTGAAYSTVTRSTAARLKARLLPDLVTVGSATSKAVPGQLAVVDEVAIAGNTFRNVVFLVMEDEALRFAGGRYTIDAILGFPVLSRMGRIEFAATAGGGEVLRVGVPSAPNGGNRDLYLDTLRPIAILEAAGAGRVRLLIDSGAKQTSLSGLFESEYPAMLTNATRKTDTVGGAGGSRTLAVDVLPELTLVADGMPRRASSVSVSAEEKGEHGALGQDILRAGGGFALDFEAMDFAFLPAP